MKEFLNFPSPHCHVQSLDSGSSPEAFAAREIELGTGAITVTDHGSLSVCRKVYDLALKKKLTPILGLEAYFRDDKCPILTKEGLVKDAKGTFTPYVKYMHLTMHALDQEAYETLVRLTSHAKLHRTEKHGSEYKPLFAWEQLEELGSKNITMTSGCLIGMVQRHLMNDRPELAIQYYERLRSIVKPGNFYVEMFPHRCDTFWCDKVFVGLEDGTKISYYDGKTVRTDAGEIKLEELVKSFGKENNKHTKLLAVKHKREWQELDAKQIVSAEKVEGFLPNECKPWAPDGDYQKGTNLFMLELAHSYNDPCLISDDSHFAKPEEKIVQDIKLRAGGGSWRFATSYHRQSSDEAFEYFKDIGISADKFNGWIKNNKEWAERFKDFHFKDRISLPTKFYPEDTLGHLKALIDKHGRMDWTSSAMLERLGSEINLLNQNKTLDLLPYFFLAEEACSKYEEADLLSGPGRGSAAGMLSSYLLGITHVDPLRYKLSQDRFLTLDRIRTGKLPDIDLDFPNRDILIDPEKGWLKTRFGDHYAQISVDTTLKLRSSIKDVARVLHDGIVPPAINKLAGALPNAPQGIADRDFVFGYKGGDGTWEKGIIEFDAPLKEYIKLYPDEWEIVQRCLGVTRQKSRHASAYAICNESVSNFIPTLDISGVVCTDYTAASVEASGGIKMDFLGLDALARLSTAVTLVQERNGGKRVDGIIINDKLVPRIRRVPFQGQDHDIWDLPIDQAVFRDICEGLTETVFQLNKPAAQIGLKEFDFVKSVETDGTVHKGIDSIEALSAFTALDRPGPLDAYVMDSYGKKHNMLVEFANRSRGGERIGAFPILDKMFPETHGIFVYQEQLQHAFQVIGKATGIEANNFRMHVGKKQMAEVFKDRIIFMKGAVESLGEAQAAKLWESMETFGQYGFNASHAVSYMVITYACAFLKRHYPLEWWTSVLRNEKDRNKIDSEHWRFCRHLVNMPDIKLSGDGFQIVGDRIQAPLSLLHGIGEKAHSEILKIRPFNDVTEMCQKIRGLRVAAAKPAIDKKTELPKVDKKGNQVLRLGNSALNKGIVSTLIVSGAASSLFPQGSGVYEQLMEYETEKAKVNGTKAKPIDQKYANVTPLTRFQMKKHILPAWSESLDSIISNMKIAGLVRDPILRYTTSGGEYPICHFEHIEAIEAIKLFPDQVIRVAAPCYIVSDERKKYQGNKDMAKLQIDVDGGRLELVKWPNRSGNLPHLFEQPLTGSVCIVLLSKFSANKPFAIDDLILIQKPLGEMEVSPEPEEIT